MVMTSTYGAMVPASKPYGSLAEAHQALTLSDNVLLARIGEGDHKAYEALVRKHVDYAWRVAMGLLRDRDEVDDVLQDVFLTIWRRERVWDAEGGARFTSWLYKVIVNRCIDQVRKTRNVSEVDYETLVDSSPSPEKEAAHRQNRAFISGLIAELPDKQREAIVLFYYIGLSTQEIAKKMQMSDDSIRALLTRARQALRGKLK